MNPQERQMVDDLFDRLAKLENAPRDPEAASAIAEGLRKAPNAVYALVQTVLLQDEALKRANAHIQELEAAHAQQQQQSGSGSFLDSMRDAIFGQSNPPQPRSSVPNVPPPTSRPVWNSGQVMQQPPGSGQPGYAAPPYGSSYGAPPFGGGGGSFLGTAAAAAAGMVGGSLLLGGIRNMMGGSHYGFAEPTRVIEPTTGGGSDRQTPWSDQSGSTLAQDAGINDIGNSRDYGDSDSRSGLLDQPSDDQDYDSDDRGDDDVGDDDGGDGDGGDFGDDGSNYA
jgi:hypothetical protein